MSILTSSHGAISDLGIEDFTSIGVGSVTSSLNASTTPLGSGQTFIGSGELVSQPDVLVIVHTDAPGTLFLDFSIDAGANYSTFPVDGFEVSAGINEFHVAVKGPRTFRARLVNGSSAQSSLRLSIFYGNFGPPNAPIHQIIASDADALIVRSVDPDVDLRRGKFQGMRSGDKFGYIEGVGTTIQESSPATWVDLWAFGGQRTPPSGTFTPFMASDDAADTGINIEVTYQDSSGIEQTVTVALNGTTPVSLGVTATDSYRAINASGTDLAGNVAITTANNFTAGVPDNQNEVLAYIPANDGQTQQLVGRVPSDKSYLLDNVESLLSRASGAAGSAIIAFQVRSVGGVFLTKRLIQISDSLAPLISLRSVILNAGDDYRVRIKDVSDNSTTISGALNFISVDA